MGDAPPRPALTTGQEPGALERHLVLLREELRGDPSASPDDRRVDGVEVTLLREKW
jgi:hypothetical protein